MKLLQSAGVLLQAALKDVEKVVAGGTTFRVCRLFTLNRHIILSVSEPHLVHACHGGILYSFYTQLDIRKGLF